MTLLNWIVSFNSICLFAELFAVKSNKVTAEHIGIKHGVNRRDATGGGNRNATIKKLRVLRA